MLIFLFKNKTKTKKKKKEQEEEEFDNPLKVVISTLGSNPLESATFVLPIAKNLAFFWFWVVALSSFVCRFIGSNKCFPLFSY